MQNFTFEPSPGMLSQIFEQGVNVGRRLVARETMSYEKSQNEFLTARQGLQHDVMWFDKSRMEFLEEREKLGHDVMYFDQSRKKFLEAREQYDQSRLELESEHFQIYKARQDLKWENSKINKKEQQEKKKLDEEREAVEWEEWKLYKAKVTASKEIENERRELKADHMEYEKRKARIRELNMQTYNVAKEERAKQEHERQSIMAQRQAQLDEWNQIQEGERRAYTLGFENGKAEARPSRPAMMLNSASTQCKIEPL